MKVLSVADLARRWNVGYNKAWRETIAQDFPIPLVDEARRVMWTEDQVAKYEAVHGMPGHCPHCGEVLPPARYRGR